MKIYAHHAHVFPKSVREDGTVDALLNVMDACSIEKAVAFATFSNFLGPGDEEPNQALAKRIRNEDRLKGFGVIDFSREDLEDQVEAIYQLGFPGIKLHPAFQHFRIDGEKAFRVYAAAQKRDLFLTFHTGIHWHRISD